MTVYWLVASGRNVFLHSAGVGILLIDTMLYSDIWLYDTIENLKKFHFELTFNPQT